MPTANNDKKENQQAQLQEHLSGFVLDFDGTVFQTFHGEENGVENDGLIRFLERNSWLINLCQRIKGENPAEVLVGTNRQSANLDRAISNNKRHSMSSFNALAAIARTIGASFDGTLISDLFTGQEPGAQINTLMNSVGEASWEKDSFKKFPSRPSSLPTDILEPFFYMYRKEMLVYFYAHHLANKHPTKELDVVLIDDGGGISINYHVMTFFKAKPTLLPINVNLHIIKTDRSNCSQYNRHNDSRETINSCSMNEFTPDPNQSIQGTGQIDKHYDLTSTFFAESSLSKRGLPVGGRGQRCLESRHFNVELLSKLREFIRDNHKAIRGLNNLSEYYQFIGEISDPDIQTVLKKWTVLQFNLLRKDFSHLNTGADHNFYHLVGRMVRSLISDERTLSYYIDREPNNVSLKEKQQDIQLTLKRFSCYLYRLNLEERQTVLKAADRQSPYGPYISVAQLFYEYELLTLIELVETEDDKYVWKSMAKSLQIVPEDKGLCRLDEWMMLLVHLNGKQELLRDELLKAFSTEVLSALYEIAKPPSPKVIPDSEASFRFFKTEDKKDRLRDKLSNALESRQDNTQTTKIAAATP